MQNEENTDKIAQTRVTFAQEGNKDAVNMLKDTCPEELKMGVFIQALVKGAVEGNKSVLTMVRDCCPEIQKKSILINVLMTCAFKEDIKALAMVKDACPEEEKATILAVSLLQCALQDNDAAIAVILNACEDLKENVLHVVTDFCEQDGHKHALRKINSLVNQDLNPDLEVEKLEVWEGLMNSMTIENNRGRHRQIVPNHSSIEYRRNQELYDRKTLARRKMNGI